MSVSSFFHGEVPYYQVACMGTAGSAHSTRQATPRFDFAGGADDEARDRAVRVRGWRRQEPQLPEPRQGSGTSDAGDPLQHTAVLRSHREGARDT